MNEEEIRKVEKQFEVSTKGWEACRLLSMIISVWCYDTTNVEKVKSSKYITKYWSKKDAKLTKAEVDELVEKQMEYLKTAFTKYAGEDSEGLWYNTIIWGENAKNTININDYV